MAVPRTRRVFLGQSAAFVGAAMSANLLAPFEALAQGDDTDELPRGIAGVYPSLAMFNNEAECGTGAVVVWGGRLWAITYGPHLVHGSSDKLYEITPDLEQIVRPESVGGTHANRMIHAESNQLFIGSYVIDADRNVRVIPRDAMPGRLTGTARHIDDPENMVHFATMEEGLYSVNVETLEVFGHIKDGNGGGLTNPTNPAEISSSLPGYHGKGLYSAPGLLVYTNNGETGSAAQTDPRTTSGALATWEGEGDWQLVRRNQFVEVSGPDGIAGGNTDPDDPLWSTGWDYRSVILMVRHGEEWHSYRLPKASHCYDGAHGWNTEWPRIRDIGEDDLLMTMHGAFWRFPRTFKPGQTAGITQRSTYLRVIGDFCRWGDRIVMGSDDSAQSEFLNKRRQKGDIEGPGQSQSNLWFVEPERLDELGVPLGRGCVWQDDALEEGAVSDPFLVGGFERRVLHLANDGKGAATFAIETDDEGTGDWTPLRELTVPAGGYEWTTLSESEAAQWVRLRVVHVAPGADEEDVAERSDEFDGLDLDTEKWAIRVDEPGHEVRVEDGKLMIPTLNEIDGTATGPFAMVSQQLPEGDFTLTVRVTPEFERSWAQAGIMVWQSDLNHVKFGFGRDANNGSRRMVLASTSAPDGDRQIGPMVPVPADFPETAWLRLHREGNVVRAEFAPDVDGGPGAWAPFGGTRTLDTDPPRYGDGVQIGLYAGSDIDGPPYEQSAAFDFARFEAGRPLRATAAFALSNVDRRPDEPAPIFDGLTRPGDTAMTGGLIRARGGGLRTLAYVADRPGASGPEAVGYYELDGNLELARVDNPTDAQWLRDNVAIPTDVIEYDEASVLVIDDDGRRWRLPKSDPAFDEEGPVGIERLDREVSTERDLFNAHGTAYELPAENAGGFAKIRPIATHGLRIKDYCSYRGMMVLSGVKDDAEGERIVRSDDGETALWLGVSDDLWAAGRPRGYGGPWANTAVTPGEPSDPYLMTGYENKVLKLSHDAVGSVGIKLEVDLTGDGNWVEYETFTVPAGEELTHEFPDEFGAYWARCTADAECTATAQFTYGEREDEDDEPPVERPKLKLLKLKRDRRSGRAELAVRISHRGSLTLRGKGVRTFKRPNARAGRTVLRIGAAGAAKRTLKRKGAVDVRVEVVYRPKAGGKALTATRKVRLVRK